MVLKHFIQMQFKKAKTIKAMSGISKIFERSESVFNF